MLNVFILILWYANLLWNLGLPTAEGYRWKSGDYNLFSVWVLKSREVLTIPRELYNTKTGSVCQRLSLPTYCFQAESHLNHFAQNQRTYGLCGQGFPCVLFRAVSQHPALCLGLRAIGRGSMGSWMLPFAVVSFLPPCCPTPFSPIGSQGVLRRHFVSLKLAWW